VAELRGKEARTGMSKLTKAARTTKSRRESLTLSERDRRIFFDALVKPPKANARLKRAFKSERKRIAPG
jgi:uncharacterized protein (DUF1778 family)